MTKINRLMYWTSPSTISQCIYYTSILIHAKHIHEYRTNTILLLLKGPREEGPEGGVKEIPDNVIVVEVVAELALQEAAAAHQVTARWSSSPRSSGLVATVGNLGLLLSSNLRWCAGCIIGLGSEGKVLFAIFLYFA